MTPAARENSLPFRDAVRDLASQDPDLLTSTGNVNWRAVSDKVGLGYDTLRKAVAGDRWPALDVMESVAKGLGVAPDYFLEYQLVQAQKQFDVRVVGWDKAIGNLRTWADQKR